jgi:hypothetical protein
MQRRALLAAAAAVLGPVSTIAPAVPDDDDLLRAIDRLRREVAAVRREAAARPLSP